MKNGTVQKLKWYVLAGSIGLSGLLMTGCKSYASSRQLLEDVQSEAYLPESRSSAEIITADMAEGQAGAQIIPMETELKKAAPVSFEAVSDTVYVVCDSGSSVRIRSACDTADPSNILSSAVRGTALKRTGRDSQWTRIDHYGKDAYIASSYISEKAPETKTEDLGEKASADQSASGKGGSEEASAGQTGASQVTLNPDWAYAGFSKIHSGAAVLYKTEAAQPKGITVSVNAGHGTKGGSSVKTQCHPDGTPKVTGGTTGAGAVTAVAVSGGMTFADGTAESTVTLKMAKILKDKLLAQGYDVLMLRDGEDVQLDNIARSVIANNASDCHIALHWDSTGSDKGVFYMSVPSAASYRNMEPVKSHWQQHNALGESLIEGLRSVNAKVFSSGSMEMDLTQTSYSTVPSVDIELGDKASDHSSERLSVLADGLVKGIEQFFGN